MVGVAAGPVVRGAVRGTVVRATVVGRAGAEVGAGARVVVERIVVVVAAVEVDVDGTAAFDPEWRVRAPMSAATNSPMTMAKPI